MTWPAIESQSLGPLANTLLIKPMTRCQMDMRHRLNRIIIRYEFELSHNTAEKMTKNTCVNGKVLYSHMPYHNDTIIKTDAMIMIKTQEDSFNKIFTSHFICKFRKGYSKFACERELETEHNWNILTPKLWPSALCLSRSPWLLNLSPGVHSAGAGFPYYISFSPLQLYSPELARRTQLSSVQFVGLISPSNSHAVIWTRLHASAISSDVWRSGCVNSAFFGMACVIVIERK